MNENNENMDAILRGRKFKKLMEHTFGDIRRKYDLRQIEVEILLYLNKNPDTNSSKIYRNLNINKGYVSQAMDNLCKKGFLQSEQDKNDRRYVSYIVTDLGKTVIEEGVALQDLMLERLFVGISEEELELMRKISTKLNNNIDHIQVD